MKYKSYWEGPRREMCHHIGRRGRTLNAAEAALAWQFLSAKVEGFGDMDIPKFLHLIVAIRAATIHARMVHAKKSACEEDSL